MFDALPMRGEHLAEFPPQPVVLRFLNGLDWLFRDAFQVVGRARYEVVDRNDTREVGRYHYPDEPMPRGHALPVPRAPAARIAEGLAGAGTRQRLEIVDGGVHGFNRIAPDDHAKALIGAVRASLFRELSP